MTSIINLKVVIVGEANVGKTTLASALVGMKSHGEPTIGAGFVRAKTTAGGVTIGFDIWDTAGQERYRSLVPMYLRGANVVVYVVDDTSESLTMIKEYWQPLVRSTLGSPYGLKCILVRNKCDIMGDPTHNVNVYDWALTNSYPVVKTIATDFANTSMILDVIVKLVYQIDSGSDEWGGLLRKSSPTISLQSPIQPLQPSILNNGDESHPKCRC